MGVVSDINMEKYPEQKDTLGTKISVHVTQEVDGLAVVSQEEAVIVRADRITVYLLASGVLFLEQELEEIAGEQHLHLKKQWGRFGEVYRVLFEYKEPHIEGLLCRDDSEREIYLLADGRVVLSTECQVSALRILPEQVTNEHLRFRRNLLSICRYQQYYAAKKHHMATQQA